MVIYSAEEFARLRLSDDPAEYQRAATEPATVEVWTDVIANYPDLRIWVAQNKTVPIEVLTLLARDGDPQVRWMVARKRKVGPELLRLLAEDSDASVRASVARHKNTPPDVLRRLADDAEPMVRREARSHLPPDDPA